MKWNLKSAEGLEKVSETWIKKLSCSTNPEEPKDACSTNPNMNVKAKISKPENNTPGTQNHDKVTPDPTKVPEKI
ncbi:hypothetical protein F8M41_015544 [Gigaspora margarita]|uniref:Uncharacterized protein n=1 Tax=Gigaspora margarita TaxID=4874 RepID=A0A8H4AQJ6_GIGMA|nr:hypothetical protein F8M41_015544 [Gigaspora margarita]